MEDASILCTISSFPEDSGHTAGCGDSMSTGRLRQIAPERDTDERESLRSLARTITSTDRDVACESAPAGMTDVSAAAAHVDAGAAIRADEHVAASDSADNAQVDRATPDCAAESPLISTDGVRGGSASPSRPDRVIEALLFSSDRPLTAARLGDLIGVSSATQVRLLIAGLNDTYVAAGLSFRIEHIAGGYQLMTLPEYERWIAKLAKQRAETRLSDAALETLSIVAYRQPVIRADIEAIRGVASGEVLNRLREMGLVKIVGRAEVVGRPMLYGTTRKFLDVFGLASLEDLPPMESLALRRSGNAGEGMSAGRFAAAGS